jgi:hypothetical protein
MIENNKGVSLIIIILGVIFFMIISLFVYQEFLSAKGEEDNINFSKIGNLLIDNPGFDVNTWYLSYETAGDPANNAKLLFDGESICKNESNSCSYLFAGDRVDIKGIESNGIVLVKELKVVDN